MRQGDAALDRVPCHELEATLGDMWTLGMKVVISEPDIDVIPRGHWWADGGKHRAELAKVDPYAQAVRPRSSSGRRNNTRSSSGCSANSRT